MLKRIRDHLKCAIIFTALAVGATPASAGVCILDGTGNCVDRSAPYPTLASTNFAASQATIGTSASLLVAARPGVLGTGRTSLTIVNGGAAIVYCGATSGVLTTTGAAIAASGGTITVPTMGAVYCISGSPGQVVSVWETY